MEETRRLSLRRRVLLAKVIITMIVWVLPALLTTGLAIGLAIPRPGG